MIVTQLVVGAGLICAVALIARYIYRRMPRYAPVSHFKHGRRIGTRSRGKSDCVWIPPNTK
jgi:hypothetical protein